MRTEGQCHRADSFYVTFSAAKRQGAGEAVVWLCGHASSLISTLKLGSGSASQQCCLCHSSSALFPFGLFTTPLSVLIMFHFGEWGLWITPAKGRNPSFQLLQSHLRWVSNEFWHLSVGHMEDKVAFCNKPCHSLLIFLIHIAFAYAWLLLAKFWATVVPLS